MDELYIKMDAEQAVSLRIEVEYLKNKLKEAQTKANYYEQIYWELVARTEPNPTMREAHQRVVDQILGKHGLNEED